MKKKFFFNVLFPLMIPISLKGRYRQLGNGKRCSLEGLALTEGFAHMLEGPLPGKVLSNQSLDLLTARIQFLLCMWLMVHLPIWTQRKGKLLVLDNPDSRNGAAFLVPKRMTLTKAFFLSLSNHWNIPAMRLQLMKVWVSSSGKQHSEYHRDQPSLSMCSPKYGSTTERVSSLEYLHLNFPTQRRALLGQESKGVLGLRFCSQCLVTFIHLLLRSRGSSLFFLFLLSLASLPENLSLSVVCAF